MIEILSSADERQEAAHVASWIQNLVNVGTPESQIAVLFSKQPEKYGSVLCLALDRAGICYRREQKLQDLAAEPLARLLVAYFETLAGAHSAAAYIRLNRGRLFGCDSERGLFRLRSALEGHIEQARAYLQYNVESLRDRRLAEEAAQGLLRFFGAPAIAALQPDYEAPERVAEIAEETIDRIEDLLATEGEVLESLARFGGEQGGVRIMSIHKSKGLEFEAVAVMAVEHEMFWGPTGKDAQRSLSGYPAPSGTC